MPASNAAGAAVRQDYLSRQRVRELLEKSGEVTQSDISYLWRFFEQTARRAGLPYVVQCRTCGPVPLGSSCRDRSAKHHAIIGLHPGSVVRVYRPFTKCHFVGIGPKLRRLMGRLVRELPRQ